MNSARKIALTVAGSDPGGGAGLQADLKTFAALGVYGFSAVTAIIAQNSARVAAVSAVSPAMLRSQLEILVDEARPDAIKVGALATAANVAALARAVRDLGLPAPVLDPVLISSSGARLLDPDGERALITNLLPLSRIVTPNIPEAEAITGIAIAGRDSLRAAAHAILDLGPQAVVIKGGHTSPAATAEAPQSVDLFFDGAAFLELASDRLPGDGAHGTGCGFSAAIAAHLALGADLRSAVQRGKEFVTHALAARFQLSPSGRFLLNHFA